MVELTDEQTAAPGSTFRFRWARLKNHPLAGSEQCIRRVATDSMGYLERDVLL